MGKDNFILETDIMEKTEILNDEEFREFMYAITAYEKTGIMPKMSKKVEVAFSFKKSDLDKNREKYEQTCKRNKQNGAKGGRKAKEIQSDIENPPEPKKPSGLFKNPTQPKEPDNDYDNDYDSDYDNDIDIPPNPPQGKATQKRVDVFSEFANKNLELLDALQEFENMRKKAKKPMTDKAKELFIIEIKKLSDNPQKQIKLINTAILHNWQTVYPPTDKSTKNSRDKPRNQNTSYDVEDNFKISWDMVHPAEDEGK